MPYTDPPFGSRLVDVNGNYISVPWKTWVSQLVSEVMSGKWPVGSVYISTVATNPAALLGFGTWVQFAQGRALVGIDATPPFDTLLGTFGEQNHVLTEAETPCCP